MTDQQIEEIKNILERHETVDLDPPYKVLPVGHPDWIDIKARQIAKLIPQGDDEGLLKWNNKYFDGLGKTKIPYEIKRIIFDGITKAQRDLTRQEIPGAVKAAMERIHKVLLSDVPLEHMPVACRMCLRPVLRALKKGE